jgi:hypothetical protein
MRDVNDRSKWYSTRNLRDPDSGLIPYADGTTSNLIGRIPMRSELVKNCLYSHPPAKGPQRPSNDTLLVVYINKISYYLMKKVLPKRWTYSLSLVLEEFWP